MAANSKVGDIGDQPRFIDYRANGQLTLIGNLSDRGKIESTEGESTILSLGNILGRIDSGNPEPYTITSNVSVRSGGALWVLNEGSKAITSHALANMERPLPKLLLTTLLESSLMAGQMFISQIPKTMSSDVSTVLTVPFTPSQETVSKDMQVMVTLPSMPS